MSRKSSKSPTSAGQYVPHYRYGTLPCPSGIKVPESDIRSGFWRLRGDTIFPETVLLAQTEKQNFAIYPRKYYVDVLRDCRTCHRPFIFFAREQRYWFETLRFFVDADCVYCPECRRESRVVQRRLRRYSDLFAKNERTRKELMFLVDDTAYLLARGVLRNLNNAGLVKNRALKDIPEYSGVAVLVEVINTVRHVTSEQ